MADIRRREFVQQITFLIIESRNSVDLRNILLYLADCERCITFLTANTLYELFGNTYVLPTATKIRRKIL